MLSQFQVLEIQYGLQGNLEEQPPALSRLKMHQPEKKNIGKKTIERESSGHYSHKHSIS